LLRRAAGRLPVFGVCLGHQALASAFGGEVGRAPRITHGKSASVQHDGQGIFSGLETPFVAGRYHSLAVRRLPPGFQTCAWIDEDGMRLPMAMLDAERRMLGVQFHPESVLTRDGSRLIARVLAWAAP